MPMPSAAGAIELLESLPPRLRFGRNLSAAGSAALPPRSGFAQRYKIDCYRHHAVAWLALCEMHLGLWDDASEHARDLVTEDLRKTFCICDAPAPEAIRKAVPNTNLPIDSIPSVKARDPYFYRG